MKALAQSLLAEQVPLLAFVELDRRKIGQTIHGAPVVAPADVERYRGGLCLAAVGQPGAREDIRQTLRAMGWSEMIDFVAVA